MARILWLDNDKSGLLMPHKRRLEVAGHSVTPVASVSQAEQLVRAEGSWDLIIVDVMLNVRESEQEFFRLDETDHGRTAGLLFLKRMKAFIEAQNASVLVFTMLEDPDTGRQLDALSLSRSSLMHKMEGSDTAVFADRIKAILRSSTPIDPGEGKEEK